MLMVTMKTWITTLEIDTQPKFGGNVRSRSVKVLAWARECESITSKSFTEYTAVRTDAFESEARVNSPLSPGGNSHLEI
jgi:hypothetical protein